MPFAFSWDSTPDSWPAALGPWPTNRREQMKYRTPLRCRAGRNCVYDGCCSDVHEGEEGTSLKYFPARVVRDGGREVWEPVTVRLIGSPRYYERRRLRLSWAAWCERVGLPAPAAAAPATPAALPSLLDAEEVEIVGEREFVTERPHTPPPAEPPSEDALRSQQNRQIAQAYQAQQAQMAFMQQQWALYWQMTAARQRVLTEKEQKEALGDELFPTVQSALERSAVERACFGYAGPLFTAGKLTGMLLEACSVDELRQLLVDDAEFTLLLQEACEVLRAAQQTQQTVETRPAPHSVTGSSVLAACAEETMREEAGLPPLERPPSITVYEPTAADTVRIATYLLS